VKPLADDVMLQPIPTCMELPEPLDDPALARVALGLAVERLMLPVLLEHDYSEQARSGEAARQHMERRRRLADPLALPAGELLAHLLHWAMKSPPASSLTDREGAAAQLLLECRADQA
jgi:hypothetical protein